MKYKFTLILVLFIILFSASSVSLTVCDDCPNDAGDTEYTGLSCNNECAVGANNGTHICTVGSTICKRAYCKWGGCGLCAVRIFGICTYPGYYWECNQYEDCYAWEEWTGDCDDEQALCEQKEFCSVHPGTGTWTIASSTGTGDEQDCCGDDSGETYCMDGISEGCYNASYHDADGHAYVCENCLVNGIEGVFDPDLTTNNCCGDNLPNASVPPDDPDTSEIFCRGLADDEYGCPIGAYTERDSYGDYFEEDTKRRAYVSGLDAEYLGQPLGCCGDDYGDEGQVFYHPDLQRYYLCDNVPGTDVMEWRPVVSISSNNVGRIYTINTDMDSIDPDFLIKEDLTDYDVVATDLQNWLACDLDNSLSPIYKTSGTFDDEEFCDGNYGSKCRTIDNSDYICYDNTREQIAECFSYGSVTGLAVGDAHPDDDVAPLHIGDMIPNPFTNNFKDTATHSFVGLIPDSSATKDLILNFQSPASYFETTQPRMSDWSGYEYLVFDIYYNRLANKDDLLIKISGDGISSINAPVNDFATSKSSDGKYHHIIIPGISSTRITEFGFVAQDSVGIVEMSNFHLTGGSEKGYYCGADEFLISDWRHDLDNDVYTNGQACEESSVLLKWTGTQCCGDDYTDDNTGFHSEFYTDLAGNCWDSYSVRNDGSLASIVNMSGKNEIISFEDGFYGCGITQEIAGIKDTLTGASVVTPVNYCDVKGQFYCSPTKGWSNEGVFNGIADILAIERTNLSYSGDGSSAGCCYPGDCWDGTTCIASQIERTGELPHGLEFQQLPTYETTENFTGYRCVGGEWIESRLKWDWFNQQWGYCAGNDDCLLSFERCVPNEWYSTEKMFEGKDVQGLYCENGDWTTRTKYVALTLLDLRNDEYVLDCGPYQQVVNVWSPQTAFLRSETFENIVNENELNNICIYSYDDNVVIASSFNPEQGEELRYVLANAFGLQNVNLASCSQNDGLFHDCGQGLWWNDQIQSFIYDPKDDIAIGGGFFANIYDWLIGGINNLLGTDIPLSVGEKSLEYLSQAKLFNQIYISQFGDKKIEAVVEKKYDPLQGVVSVFSVTYTGFPVSVCPSVTNYDWFVANVHPEYPTEDIFCSDEDDTNLVVAVDSSMTPDAFNRLVSALTRKTRIEG